MIADRQIPLLFEELTRLQLREMAPSALAVLPVGATEQRCTFSRAIAMASPSR